MQATSPLIYVGGRGSAGALAMAAAARLPGFRFVASSGAGMALGLLEIAGPRGVELLLKRHRLLVSGVDTWQHRHAELESLLRELGANPHDPTPEKLSLLAFDCVAKVPTKLRSGTLAEALLGVTSLVPARVGFDTVIDLELLLCPKLVASGLSAFACFCPDEAAAAAGRPEANVFLLVDRFTERVVCEIPVFRFPRQHTHSRPLRHCLLASTLLVFAVWLLTRGAGGTRKRRTNSLSESRACRACAPEGRGR